jgi:hypothetical protein
MALHGKGMLIVFNEVARSDERDFNEWYNREHIDERVALPGFGRSRRYVAASDRARGRETKYLATYECARVEDLATPSYLKLLANQTAWTQRVMARFTRFQRLTLNMRVDLNHGVGGAVTCLRFAPRPGDSKILSAWLRDEALPQAIARPGMLGGAAGDNDLEIANAPAKFQGVDYPRADEVEWVILLEGAEPADTAAAARALFKLSALKPFGVTRAPSIATYRLLYGNQR